MFGVDTSLKWIDFELEGTSYSIHFKNSLSKGVTDIEVFVNEQKTDAKIKSAYPPLFQMAQEIWQVWLLRWINNIIKHRR